MIRQINSTGAAMKSAWAIRCCALVFWSVSAVAQQHPACAGPQLGTWALLSMETEDQETGQKHNLLGAHPSGYLSYGADCPAVARDLPRVRGFFAMAPIVTPP